MNTTLPLDLRAIEAHVINNAAIAEQTDRLFPVEASAKPTGAFASDCCGSNNYPV